MKPNQSIKIIHSYPITASSLWACITQLDRMQIWFFPQLNAFEPIKGFETEFSFVHNEKTFTHQWSVLEVEQNSKLLLGWKYKEYDGEATACFEIKTQKKGVELILTATIIKEFPPLEEFNQENMVAGWTGLLKTQLEEYVSKYLREN